MKEVVLFIDGKTVGPFSEEDVRERFAAGEFSAETPCAEPGAAEWTRLGDVFPAKKSVRVARKTQKEEEEMKTAVSEKLDPEVRKKLLLYNLADAISVDKFTPVQADAAIRVHEAELQKGKKLKIAAGVGGFVLSFALAWTFFSCVNVGTAPGGRGLKIFEKAFWEPSDPALAKELRRVLTDKERLTELREEVANVKFLAPRGQGSPRQTFLGHVEIKNPDISDVTGTADFSALAGTVPPELFGSAKFEAIQLSRLDQETEKRIAEQNRLFLILTSPPWDDAALRGAIAKDLASEYPYEDGVPESAEFLKYVKGIRASGVPIDAQLQALNRRLGEIAQSKEIQARLQNRMAAKFKARSKGTTQKDGGADGKTTLRVQARAASSKRAVDWASGRMPKFMEKLTDYLAEKEIYYSAEARRDAGTSFFQEEFPKIAAAVEKNETQRAPVAEDGSFVLPGRNTRNIIFVAHFSGAGDIYFVPSSDGNAPSAKDGSANLVSVRDLKVNRKTLTPEDVLMDERYKVVAKEKTGGVPLAASGKLLSRDVYIVRTTPEWFYVTVEKVPDADSASRRRTSVVLRVPPEFYETVALDQEIPMEKLLTFERYSRPMESPSGGRLIPIPDDKLEAVKEAQKEAGFAFPPPPEQAFVPPPKKEVAAEDVPEAAEDAPEASGVPAEEEAADAPEESGE